MGCLDAVQPAFLLPVREDNDPNHIEIVYKTFIPCDVVGPIPPFNFFFDGDGRDFSYTSNDYRSFQSVTISSDIEEDAIVSGPNREFGVSELFTSETVQNVSPGELCGYQFLPGAVPFASGKAEVTNRNSRVVVRRSIRNITRTNVRFVLRARLPVFPGPAINSFLNVRIFDGDPIEYSIQGRHDGFPSHEVYVNGNLVYGYDPRDSDKTPNALFPPLDERVFISRREIPR